MRRYATPLVLLVLSLAAAPGAYAGTVTCKPGTYGGADPSAFPAVGDLTATGLPKKTDGYAPPCLVADSVAGLVQASYKDEGDGVWSFASSVHPMGARWDGGRWVCSYQSQSSDTDAGYVEWVQARCHRRGVSSRRVAFTLGS